MRKNKSAIKICITFFIAFLFLFINSSCSKEMLRINYRDDNGQDPSSLINDSEYVKGKISDIESNIEKVKYTSDLTNIISTIPKFSNTAVNMQIGFLKSSLQSYFYATNEQNKNDLERAYKDYSKSFKELQKLKRKMDPDEKELLDHYLTRIKSNINSLEYLY